MSMTFSKKEYYEVVNNRFHREEELMVKLFGSVDKDFIPTKGKELDAGYDCRARIDEPITLAPLSRIKVPLGFGISVPVDNVGDLRPRSGLTDKYGIVCGYGTIDPGYTNEVSATIFNLGAEDFIIEPKMRIVQLVLTPTVKSDFTTYSDLTVVLVDQLATGERGTDGHGSTGLF